MPQAHQQPHPTSTSTTSAPLALIDAHVHLHPRFDLPVMFDHAAVNIARAAARLHLPPQPLGILMLTESLNVDRFAELSRRLGQRLGRWHVHPRDENESLQLVRDTGQQLTLIAGRQIVTRERLEVLALGTRRRFDDHQPIEDIIHQLKRTTALTVIPWGFGKWTGKRGQTLRQLLQSPLADGLFLGDNAGRPQHTPTPSLFHLARQHAVRLLPGTDPLPLPRQQHRAGRFGFILPIPPDNTRPFHTLHHLLHHHLAQPRIFGRRDGYLAFIAAQLALRLPNFKPAT
ncbi:hypothetical protein ACERK3_12500 [Phycisphaerales bacterium AB-hyl4]|uniref:Amidohydrolase-related domain-containing protein n=1 Tax=Natronomicrosphaera hydrolytica TaxID=3242702 RepID=A0ABV4U680_9BACT